jgi:hypothetical protein
MPVVGAVCVLNSYTSLGWKHRCVFGVEHRKQRRLGVFAIAVSKGVQKVEEDKRAAIASQVAASPNTTPQSVEVRRAEPVTPPTIKSA